MVLWTHLVTPRFELNRLGSGKTTYITVVLQLPHLIPKMIIPFYHHVMTQVDVHCHNPTSLLRLDPSPPADYLARNYLVPCLAAAAALHPFVEYHMITRALVCRSATANHLCEELYGLQCIQTLHYRIKLQNGVLLAANALFS
jgi:hypothetical protein